MAGYGTKILAEFACTLIAVFIFWLIYVALYGATQVLIHFTI